MLRAMMKYLIIALIALSGALALEARTRTAPDYDSDDKLKLPEERHLRNIRQLTFGGENAEAYFSSDGKKLILQSTRQGHDCDQIYTINIDGTGSRMVSTGKGRTTCAYFFRDGKRILYSSTHLASAECPPKPDFSRGYVWALYPGFDIFTASADGSDLKQLTNAPGYDAEATISPDGKKIVFTSVRDGDLDIYTMDIDGRNVKRLTSEVGYDGGPFFSYDNQWIVYRAHHPETEKEIADYKALLKENLIRPTKLDIYAINVDGSGLERITYNDTFDGFPMFSPDGKKLVFASNRNAKSQGETNVFIADWVP